MAAMILERIPNNMQGGRNNRGQWLLVFDNPQHQETDPLMGWTGGGDTQGQIRMTFPTCEAAVAFAELQGLKYHVLKSEPRVTHVQSYAENFSRKPLEEWDADGDRRS